MKLNQLKATISHRKSKRLGRGTSSGKGRTATRGNKGQKSRSGYNIPRRFEGGQMTLIQRLAKKGGFKSQQLKPVVINLDQLEKKFKQGEVVSPGTLNQKGLIDSKKEKVKILGRGKLTKKLKFHGCLISKSARKLFGKD